jgi:hypothetical protein
MDFGDVIFAIIRKRRALPSSNFRRLNFPFGYGDILPNSSYARFLVMAESILGIILAALVGIADSSVLPVRS